MLLVLLPRPLPSTPSSLILKPTARGHEYTKVSVGNHCLLNKTFKLKHCLDLNKIKQ